MKTLFIGGIKSGKSRNAENYALKHADTKPIYLATNEFFDEEMKERVEKHKQQRLNKFETIEEPLKLSKMLAKRNSLVLVECISMWINNMLYHGFNEEEIMSELKSLEELPNSLVFVVNDVSCSVVSDNALVRKFVDINGRSSQLLASLCDEVYQTTAGISVKIK